MPREKEDFAIKATHDAFVKHKSGIFKSCKRVIHIIKALKKEYGGSGGVGYGWSGTYPSNFLYVHFRLEGVNQVTDRKDLYWQNTASPETFYTVPTRNILVRMIK